MNEQAVKRIFIAGHQGMVGAALVRELKTQANTELIVRTRAELDLCNQHAVNRFFSSNKLDEVYLAAAKVGGIHANDTYPAEFAYQNLMIQSNVVNAAHQNQVNKLLFLGSSCIYPKLVPQPMSEDALFNGDLEPTNEAYAIAKLAGIKLCQAYSRQYGRDYRSVMPTNLYGPNDNFHPQNSHVVPAMMLRFHQAKLAGQEQVQVWGSGAPLREFMHVYDMASACVYIMQLDRKAFAASDATSHINVGTGVDCSIAELAQAIKEVVGFKGDIVFDSSKPDGAPRKLLDVSRLTDLGWQARISLNNGLQKTYAWMQENQAYMRGLG